MQFLDETNRKALEEKFNEEVLNEITITLFTEPDLKGLVVPGRGCETCVPTQELLEEVPNLSSKITLETVDYRKNEHDDVTLIPTIIVSGDGETNVKYLGIPVGTEFPVLIDMIVNVSKGFFNLSEATKNYLNTFGDDLFLKVFVTPN